MVRRFVEDEEVDPERGERGQLGSGPLAGGERRGRTEHGVRAQPEFRQL